MRLPIVSIQRGEVDQQRRERTNRSVNQPRDVRALAAGFEKAFAQVNQMALGLHFQRAPHVGGIDRHAGERVRAKEDRVLRDDGAVFERKGVEGGGEFVGRQQQRHRQAGTGPGVEPARACGEIRIGQG